MATPGLRLGPENNNYLFSGASTPRQVLGATFGGLGPGLFRAVQFPANFANIPASGDHWLVLFFRTAGMGSTNQRFETLLGVRGSGITSGAGTGNYGGIYFNGAGWLTGVVGNGQDTFYPVGATPGAGSIACLRQNAGYQLWPQATTGAPTAVSVLPDTDYALFFGIQNVGGTDYGQMILVRLSDLSVQTAQSPQALSPNRATTKAMFDQIGAMGSASASQDSQGFGGAIGDFAVFNATFPTTALAQSIASGATSIPAVTAAIGAGTLVYWNPLNGSIINGGSLAAQVGPAAMVVGANILPCAPIRNAAGLTLRRLGAHFVFPIACGANDGNVWFEGTAPAGANVTCQLNYQDGSQSAAVRVAANAQGAYLAAIRSPGGKPFFRQASLDGGSVFLDGDIMDVGIVIPVLGQSQLDHMFHWTSNITSGVTDNGMDNTGHSLGMPGAYTGPWASWVDGVNISNLGVTNQHVRGQAPRPQIMLGSGMPGDGIVAACAALISALNYSVMVVVLSHSGTPMDAMLFDGQTFTLTPTLTGSGAPGSPYAATLAITQQAVTAKTGFPGIILKGGFINGVTPGSVTITFPNGGSPIQVTDVFTGYTDAATCTGTLTGPNGASGAINYMTGAISLSFTTPPSASGVTATWTVKQEILDTSYNPKTANLNGWGARQAVDQVGQAGLRYGWTVGWHWWVLANITDSPTVVGMSNNVAAKIGLLQQMMTGGSLYPGYIAPGLNADPGCLKPPMIVAPEGRNTNPSYFQTIGTLDVARQAQASLWPSGANPQPFMLAGAWYYDYAVETTTVGTGHPDHSDLGGRRIGRRIARDVIAAFTGNRAANRGPEWGIPSFSGNVCTVPLAYIGPGLSLTTPGNPSALDEWYVGTDSSQGVIVDNAAFATAAIRSDGKAVVITNLTGPWAGTEVIRYLVGAPGAVVQGPPPLSLLYDNRGGFGGYEPGLPAAPRYP